MVGHVMATVCCIMALAGSSIPTQAPDPCSATYILDSTAITLTNCRSEVEAAPGSSSKRVTVALKGMTAYGDVTGDGKTDSAVVGLVKHRVANTITIVGVSVNARKPAFEGRMNRQLLLKNL